MNGRARALLVDESGQPDAIAGMLATHGIRARVHSLEQPANRRELSDTDVAVISVDWGRLNGQRGRILSLINTLAQHHIATLVMGVPESVSFSGPLIDHVPPGANAADVQARLGSFVRYAPMVRRLERELNHLQRLGKRLNTHFADVDQELRLAGRLQRDFLPCKLPNLPPLSFESLYRPATWVSGDTYDVFRIDERHVGLFVGDAVGHGMAAGLLSMFVRNALTTKHVGADGYEVVSPADAMNGLHQALVQQSLPNCWFVTASYIIINTATLEIRHARGGHPFPILIPAEGPIRELQAGGGLLGVPDIDGGFEQDEASLNAGDKIVVYSDGVERCFVERRDMETLEAEYTPELREWARLPAKQLIQRLSDHLDVQEGSLHPADDSTVVVLEVAR
jgi:sigma-B regulation protein RsbU (phosphoserine phosphatase)